ncbi:MAG: hypothetical protein H7Y12_07170, partial [Sphingobacteriaceae bacterium]|nr:hypothetical protein [Cytophagaceae bacterium]
FSNGTPDGEPRPGVWIQRQNGSTGNGLVIENNEFDSNVDCHLLLEGCVGGRVDQNRFLARETTWNQNRLMLGTAIKFRTSIRGAKNTKITLSTNTFRAQHKATGASRDWESTWFDFGNDPNNSDVVVYDWEVNEAGPNVVDYSGLNPNSRVKIYKASRLVQSPQQTPQFSGRITRNQPLGTTATGRLLFETVNDPQNRYDEPSGEFVAPYAGHYTVAFGVTLSGAQPGQKIVLLVKAGDTIARQKVVYASGKGEEYFDFSTTVYGAAGAKYNVQVYGAGPGTLTLAGGAANNYLSVLNVP